MLEIIKQRHSVRSFTSKKIEEDVKKQLLDKIEQCNLESGLHIQLVTEDEKAFSTFLAHYGKFENVRNYIALIGRKAEDLEEKIGYYGEQLVLFAQQLGLNTCWVAMTFSKRSTKQTCKIEKDEKIVCVLALGYGTTQGVLHRIKAVEDVCTKEENMPDWYRRGLEYALLAPTAMNQQKFLFHRDNKYVSVKSTGGFYSKVDLGIVKYHFELGAGKEKFNWK